MNEGGNGAAETSSPTWLPTAARKLLIVGGPSPDELELAAALEVAESVASQRPRTLFVNTVMGSAGPDVVLGAMERPGLGDAVTGARRVAEIAFRPAGRSFIAVPAGASCPGILELWTMPAFRHLAMNAGRGGTFLLHVTETDLARLCRTPDALEQLPMDGLILLGDATVPRHLPPGLRVLARVTPEPRAGKPVPKGAGASGSAPTQPSGFSRPSGTPAIVVGGGGGRRSGGRLEAWWDQLRRRVPASGIGGVVVVWLVAVLAVWLVWQGLSGWPAFEDEFIPIAETEIPTDGTAGSSESGAEPAGGDAGDMSAAAAASPDTAASGGETPETNPASGPSGAELRYSVLVASVFPYEDAARKRDELNESGSLAFIAPTPVGGRLYYRVFAGALEDRVQAREVMRRLVERGVKERERDWDMRPVRFALHLGDYLVLEEAESERERLHESGVPAYVLPAGDSTGAIYRLYSGAFESAQAAVPADSLLTAAGVSARLVSRRGNAQ